MKRILAVHAALGAASIAALVILGSGCIMINSKSEIDLDASLLKYRASEIKLKHAASNTVSNTAAWEGGGTLDAQIPLQGNQPK